MSESSFVRRWAQRMWRIAWPVAKYVPLVFVVMLLGLVLFASWGNYRSEQAFLKVKQEAIDRGIVPRGLPTRDDVDDGNAGLRLQAILAFIQAFESQDGQTWETLQVEAFGSPDDSSFLKAALAVEELGPVFDLLDQALESQECKLVFDDTYDQSSLTNLCGAMRRMCYWLNVDAALKMRRGDVDGAIHRLKQVYRLVDCLESVDTHLTLLVGVSMEYMGSGMINNWLNWHELDRVVLGQVHSLVENRPNPSNTFINSSRGELAFMLAGDQEQRFWQGLSDYAKHRLWVKYHGASYIDHAQMMNEMVGWDLSVEIGPNARVDFMAKLRSGWWLMVNPAQVDHEGMLNARRLLDMIELVEKESFDHMIQFYTDHEDERMASYLGVAHTTKGLRHHQLLLRLGLLVEKYRVEHKAWPATLSELGDSVVIPSDPWTGEALRYERLGDGVVLYTVESEFHTNPLEQRDWRRLRLLGPSERGVKVDRDEAEG